MKYVNIVMLQRDAMFVLRRCGAFLHVFTAVAFIDADLKGLMNESMSNYFCKRIIENHII